VRQIFNDLAEVDKCRTENVRKTL